jgi:hypothetical protein
MSTYSFYSLLGIVDISATQLYDWNVQINLHNKVIGKVASWFGKFFNIHVAMFVRNLVLKASMHATLPKGSVSYGWLPFVLYAENTTT